MKRIIVVCIFYYFIHCFCAAQQTFQGPGVEISNITYQVSVSQNSVGAFQDVAGVLDMSKGLLMTSGSAYLAKGPNNKPDEGISNGSAASDPDLQALVPSEKLYDVTVIEFDINGSNSVLSFNYVFASEEYPEFERSYNDVFAFFISGPGIQGKKNLAQLKDNTLVSVKSINSSKNSQFFVSNGAGSNPAKNFYMQYDGFTKKLKAETEIVPCETYHIKLAIADARDEILDSGVFIEQESFTTTSKIHVEVVFEYPQYDYAVEGCNKGYFVIKKLPEWTPMTSPIGVEFTLSGSADNGVDFPMVSTFQLVIPENEMSVHIEIDALSDAFAEGAETVVLDVILRCSRGIITTAKATMQIKDWIDYPIESFVCHNVLTPINTNASDRYQFFWENSNELSCWECPSPSVQLSADAIFYVKVKDIISGCETTSNADVKIKHIRAYFTYHTDNRYSTLDAFFNNLSEGTNTYQWDFGDGTTSDLETPTHSYSWPNEFRPLTYTISLSAGSRQPECYDEYDTTIVIDEPFFIPNVVTPNNDCCNQSFDIKGIGLTWKIEIYDRWGILVFKSDHYQNNWSGNNVSSGVYYYVLTNPAKDRKLKGWLHVMK
jgi:gliding motility-associated-like protein